MSEIKEEEKELIKKFENTFKQEIEIVELFNLLSESTYAKYYSKLEIQDDEKLIIFELVENRLKLLEQSANESDNNFEALLTIEVFKQLFMAKNTFKIKGLKSKKTYFNTVIKLLKDNSLNEDEKESINRILSEISLNGYNLFYRIIEDFGENYYFAYCFYLILTSSESNKVFFEPFISFIKGIYNEENENINLEMRIDFPKEEIDKIPLNHFINDLYNIYVCDENYIILVIENNHIEIKKMGPEEIKDIINKKEPEKIKKKKKKKKIITKKNDNKNKDEIVNKISSVNTKENKVTGKTNLEKNENVDNSKNKIICEKENKIIVNNIVDAQAEEIKDSEKKSKEIYEEIEQVDNSRRSIGFEDRFNNLTLLVKKLQNQVSELLEEKEKFQTQINELKKEISNKNNKHGKYKRIIKNMKSNFEEINTKSIKLENELKLIQLRDTFKNIIDLFSKSLDISQERTYIDKIFQIQEKIKNSKLETIKQEELFKFLEKIYFYLQFSNKNAHSIDLDKPVLSQVFTYIDPKDQLKNLRTQLENGKANTLLKELALNRRLNFNNKSLLISQEQKIIDKVNTIEDILS